MACLQGGTRLSPVGAEDLAAVARDGGAPGGQADAGADEADTAVAEADADAVLRGAQGGDAARACAIDVGPGVVDAEAAVEGALEEAAVHPRGAAVGGYVLVRLPVLDAGVVLD